jgi:hypothetical protein
MIYTDNWNENSSVLIKPIIKDCLVKISNGVERFYVLVIRVKKNGEIVGRVSNLLVFEKPYKKDDLVYFRPKNALEILTADERSARQEEMSPAIQNHMAEYIVKYIEEYGKYPSEKERCEYFERSMNTRYVLK